MAKHSGHGGKRPGAGRTIVDIQLDALAGKELRELLLAADIAYNRTNCDAFVQGMIHQRRLDQKNQDDLSARSTPV